VKQLHVEFSDICWQYNIHLLPPVFEISQTERQLGSWVADTRTIRISFLLISRYSWAVTLNVLKHEIAHQICSEIFQSKETAHGEIFSKACDLLGVPEEYRRASGDLSEDIDYVVSGKQSTLQGRRFIDKVEKLLALAQSANENEAALAMQKANELIEKYNIKQLEVDQDIKYTYVIINKKKKRIEAYQRQICAILRDFFFVKIVTSYLYDPFADQTHKTIEILGSHENVAIAEYCYHFLENQLLSLWSRNRRKYTGSAGTEKNSYYLGILSGFRTKLLEQKEKPPKEGRGKNPKDGKKQGPAYSLTPSNLVENTGLHDYVEMKFPRLRKLSRQGPKIYKSTYEEGLETGKKITLHKGVVRKEENGRKLLIPMEVYSWKLP